MKFNKIVIDETITSAIGIKEIEIDKLSTVIAFIGKNGSGKTRVLNLIDNNFSSLISINNFINGNISDPPKQIAKLLVNFRQYEKLYKYTIELEDIERKIVVEPNNSDLIHLRNELANKVKGINYPNVFNVTKKNQVIFNASNTSINNPSRKVGNSGNKIPSEELKRVLKEMEPVFDTLKHDYFKRIDYTDLIKLDAALSYTSEESNSFEKIIEGTAEYLNYEELGSLYKSSLNFLRKLPHKLLFDRNECLGDIPKFENRASFKRFTRFKEIFKAFFDKELNWTSKSIEQTITENYVQSTSVGQWTINGREFNYSEFSEGEKTLFAFVLLLFLISQNSNTKLSESIIVIDEPELHLHPDAEINLIQRLKDLVKDQGQLIIATHSIYILSTLKYNEVFVLKEGEILKPSSKTQVNAVYELMNIEGRIINLSNLLVSISDWTYVNFIMECFNNPEVIEYSDSNDPQIRTILELLDSKQNGKPTMLLDFGAGKGRLFNHIASNENLLAAIEYSALEPVKELHNDLKSKGVSNIYSSFDQLEEKYFDFIVLCNVLHEIPIDKWVIVLNKLIKSLKETGNLIIVEAKYLSQGEKIEPIGYILFDEEDLKELFSLRDLGAFYTKETYDKITSVIIPKSKLRPISNQYLLEILQKVERKTFKRIGNLINEKNQMTPTEKGRHMAFLSQLYINLRFSQSYLTDRSKGR